MEDSIKHYLVSGQVQGVGFRAFTHGNAVDLKLRGWVRNLADGRVEILARGQAGVLMTFESRLRTGPSLSRVESVLCTEWSPVELPAEFEFRNDGHAPSAEA